MKKWTVVIDKAFFGITAKNKKEAIKRAIGSLKLDDYDIYAHEEEDE